MNRIRKNCNDATIGSTESTVYDDGLNHKGIFRSAKSSENGRQSIANQSKQAHGLTSNKTLLVASFFAGVGGIDLGLAQTGRFQTVYANEFDRYAAMTFGANFGLKVDCRDIRSVQPKDIPDVDIFAFGFPCQCFSIAGKQHGFADEKGRGLLFFEVLRLANAKKPRILLAENVKNLATHNHGNTLRVIQEAMEDEGYKVKYLVMDASKYGNVPQHRERIILVGFTVDEDYERFSFPEPIPLTIGIRDVIDFVNPVQDKYYYYPNRYTNGIYEKLNAEMNDPTAIYQWRRTFVRKNMSSLVQTLTANMGQGGHNVPLIRADDGRIRKLTPHECFNVQGFPSDFVLPNISDSQLYKQAGNSVCVGLFKRLGNALSKAML